MDKILGDNIIVDPGEDAQGDWMDEDAGWSKTKIKISVPFTKKMKHSGPRKCTGVELHHRSLVQVIKERLADSHTTPQFHVEPYELCWQHTEEHPEVKLHSKMYTSEAFLQAHKDLQQSLCEPGCNLEWGLSSLLCFGQTLHTSHHSATRIFGPAIFSLAMIQNIADVNHPAVYVIMLHISKVYVGSFLSYFILWH